MLKLKKKCFLFSGISGILAGVWFIAGLIAYAYEVVFEVADAVMSAGLLFLIIAIVLFVIGFILDLSEEKQELMYSAIIRNFQNQQSQTERMKTIMYCSTCGKQVPDHAAFCNSCGASLKDDHNTEKQTSSAYTQQQIPYQQVPPVY